MPALVLTRSAPSRAVRSAINLVASAIRRLANIELSKPARSLRGAVAPAARRRHIEGIAGPHLAFVSTQQFDHRTVLAFNPIPPERRRPAARHAIGPDPAMAGEDGGGHAFQEADPADNAVPALVPALAAGAAPDLEFLQKDGKAPFQHLGIGEAGIGHMGLNRIGAVEI